MDEQLNGAQTRVLEAYLAHQIPGRVRLKVPAAKGQAALLDQIAALAGSASGVSGVEYNALTGSVVIRYVPAAYKDVDALALALSDSKLRVALKDPGPVNGARSDGPNEDGSGTSVAATAITSFFRSLDLEIRDATGNQIDLKVLLPAVAGILGFFAFRQKAGTPLWLTLLIFSFHSFVSLNREQGRSAESAINA